MGNSKISCEVSDAKSSENGEVLQIERKSKQAPIIIWNPAALEFPRPLAENQLNAVAKNHGKNLVPGKYIYIPPIGTKFSSAGFQKLSVLFVPQDVSLYRSVSHSVNIIVTKCIPILDWTVESVIEEYGKVLDESYFSCKCTNLIGGTYEYSHNLGTLLQRGKHQIYVSYYPSDKMNCANAYASRTVTVLGLLAPLVWRPILPIQFTEPLTDEELNAKITDKTVTGTMKYNVDIGTVLEPGTHNLEVKFVPTDSYTYRETCISRTILIVPRTPPLAWMKPFSLYDGEPLDQNTLNCQCLEDIYGSFVYTPPAGTILSVGRHQLSVTFHPFDTHHYETAEKSVLANVLPKEQ